MTKTPSFSPQAPPLLEEEIVYFGKLKALCVRSGKPKEMQKFIAVLHASRTAVASERRKLIHDGVITKLNKFWANPSPSTLADEGSPPPTTQGSSAPSHAPLSPDRARRPKRANEVSDSSRGAGHHIFFQEHTEAVHRLDALQGHTVLDPSEREQDDDSRLTYISGKTAINEKAKNRAVASSVQNLALGASDPELKARVFDDDGLVHLYYLITDPDSIYRERGLEALLHLATGEDEYQEAMILDRSLFSQVMRIACEESLRPRERALAFRVLAQLAHNARGARELNDSPYFGPVVKALRNHSHVELASAANQVCRIAGFGIELAKAASKNVLAIDGGGTRAVVTIEMLKRIRDLSGKEIHEIFDLIAGTSTGAILAYMIGVKKIGLEEVEQLYLELSRNVFMKDFRSNGRLLVEGNRYSTTTLENVLRDYVGDASLSADETPSSPKVFACAALTSVDPAEPFLFRNYTPPVERPSRYLGSCKYRLYEGLRASTAAPSYFNNFKADKKVFMDGGLMVNNPSGIALHEAKQLWGRDAIRCVVSMGTGSYASETSNVDETSWFSAAPVLNTVINTTTTLLNSSTDTEHVHHVLDDTLHPNEYFRFNPLVGKVGLDTSDTPALEKMQTDTHEFIEGNAARFTACADALSPAPPKVEPDATPEPDTTTHATEERAPYTWSLRTVWDGLLSRAKPRL